MKKTAVILAMALILCSCAPAATPQATVIQPTNTPELTNTPAPTRTPVPTNTPVPTVVIPTATSSPTSTLFPTPNVPLRQVLITISDFANMSDFYSAIPILNDKNSESPIILDSSEETFVAKDSNDGNVTMTLIRYKISSDAKDINDGLKLAVTLFDVSFSNTTVPDNFWVGDTLTGEVWASATHNDVLIQLKIEHSASIQPERYASFALLLIKNQELRLIDGGY